MTAGRRASKFSGADAHHMKLAARQAVLSDAVGVERGEIVAGTDDDRLGFNRPAAGLETRRDGAERRRLAQERYAMALGQVGRELRDGVARFHPYLMRTVERAGKFLRPKFRAIFVKFARLNEPALRPISVSRNSSITARASGRRATVMQAALDDRRFSPPRRPRPRRPANASRAASTPRPADR